MLGLYNSRGACTRGWQPDVCVCVPAHLHDVRLQEGMGATSSPQQVNITTAQVEAPYPAAASPPAPLPAADASAAAAGCENQLPRSTGWYVHPTEGEFNAIAAQVCGRWLCVGSRACVHASRRPPYFHDSLQTNTDKVSTHNYGILYSRAFHLPAGKPRVRAEFPGAYGHTC
jgi:hypothetical protein